MKKHRIIQIGKNDPKFKIQERFLFFWVDKVYNIIESNHRTTPPIYRHYPKEMTLKGYIFNNVNDARYVLDNYKEISYNNETIYPCIEQTDLNKIQVFYFRAKDRMAGCLDVIKNDIDRERNIKIEEEKRQKEITKDRKYKKVIYTE